MKKITYIFYSVVEVILYAVLIIGFIYAYIYLSLYGLRFAWRFING
jgi:hypothetical protein